MNALRNLQRSFASDIWNEGSNQLDGVILDGPLPAKRLFQVYRNNFWNSVEAALGEVFCAVKQLVGDQFFTFMVRRFLRSYPLRHGNLHELGSELPFFLNGFNPAEKLPYLFDVARLEWAYHHSFHAANAKPFDPQLLSRIPPQRIRQLRFSLAPDHQLVCSRFPIFRIWKVNQPGYEGDRRVDLNAGGDSVLVARPHLAVELHKLGRADSLLLQSVTDGHNLEQAVEIVLKNSPEFDLQATLAKYLFSGVLVPETPTLL